MNATDYALMKKQVDAAAQAAAQAVVTGSIRVYDATDASALDFSQFSAGDVIFVAGEVVTPGG